jgi:hypothetical protein
MMPKMRYPFEVAFSEIEGNEDSFVSAVFDTLQSSFLILPRGAGFVAYSDFQQAYEVLKRYTTGFTILEQKRVMEALQEDALVLLVLRAMLGFTPPELAYVASEQSGIAISQGYARSLDRRVRVERQLFQSMSTLARQRVTALVDTTCHLLHLGAEEAPVDMLHRLDKADTRHGVASVRHLAAEGAPYAMLLYERYLGRPFAGHRDSISELVGEVMENAVENRLRKANISFRKTRRAEKLEGFDQSPDFIIPDEWNPRVVVEAKITEDDGTARDKITRIQHLASISDQRRQRGQAGFQVIACIDGRGFGVRRADMRKLILATKGKIFTLSTLEHLVNCSELRNYRGDS